MKASTFLFFAALSTVWLPATSEAGTLCYQFAANETNVYRIEVEQHMETGTSTTTGNIIVTPLDVCSNFFRLGFHASFDVRNISGDRPTPPFFGRNMWNGGVSLPDGCELQFDADGNILRVVSDYPLLLPLGSVLTELIQPLPAKAKGETVENTFVIDSPYWLGPSPVLMPPGQQGYGPPFYLNYGNRQNIAALAVFEKTQWKTVSTVSNLVMLHKSISLESRLQFDGHPQINAHGEGSLVFDTAHGLFTSIEMTCTSHGVSKDSARENYATLKIRRLEGRERDDVLTPPPQAPPPPVPPKLTAEDVQKIISDLKSSDANTRCSAIGKLNGTPLDAPTPELISLVVARAFDDDNGTRQNVASLLGKYGTTNEVPVLIKMLKDDDDGVCQNAAKALANLKDGRAIQPLTDLLATGVRINQYNQIQNYQFMQDIGTALQAFGPAAEQPVTTLLAERNIETRRQACIILKQIGTTNSLSSLNQIVGDPSSLLNQAVEEAVHAIKQRQ